MTTNFSMGSNNTFKDINLYLGSSETKLFFFIFHICYIYNFTTGDFYLVVYTLGCILSLLSR